jgi:hypothetical protein
MWKNSCSEEKLPTILRQRIRESAHLFLVKKYYWDDKIKGNKLEDNIWGRREI